MSFIIDEKLIYRKIERSGDIDYFIETDCYPIHLASFHPALSRLQFPKSRAILLRTSPSSSMATIHILRDIDLYSSFVNFEVDLTIQKLYISHQGHSIEMIIKE